MTIEYYGCCRTTVGDVHYDPCSAQGCHNPELVEEYNMEECSICRAEREIMEERERETRRREARERVERWVMEVAGQNIVEADDIEKMTGDKRISDREGEEEEVEGADVEKMLEGMEFSENGEREPAADGGQGNGG